MLPVIVPRFGASHLRSEFRISGSLARRLRCALLLGASACASVPFQNQSREYWAFTAPWDAHSDSSARVNAGRFDAVVYGWMTLDTVTAHPVMVYADTLARFAPVTTRQLLLVTNGVGGTFHPDVVRNLGASDSAAARVASEVAAAATRAGYAGLVMDFEGLSVADVPATTRIVRAVADSGRAHRLSPIAVAVPALDTAAYPARAFLGAVDRLVVMLYDQHWATSPPGPIAAPDWVRAALGRRVAESGAQHIVAALPAYGYEWPVSGAGIPVGYDQARRVSAAAGVELARDTPTSTLHAEKPGEWSIWVADAELLRALLSETDAVGVTQIALWRLGLEDPAIWPLLKRQ